MGEHLPARERRASGFDQAMIYNGTPPHPLADAPDLAIRVHSELENLIVTRALPPGTRLVENDLARSLGVSRGPVRAALQQLAQDGFVERKPRRQGAFVRIPTAKEVDDFFDIRRVLEGESARLAALRISPEDGARLQKCVDDGRKQLEKKRDPAQKPPFLHQLISDAADNPQLSRFLELHGKRSKWYKPPFEVSQRSTSWEEHARVVAAIVRKDPEAAVSAMYDHIDAARKRFKAYTSSES